MTDAEQQAEELESLAAIYGPEDCVVQEGRCEIYLPSRGAPESERAVLRALLPADYPSSSGPLLELEAAACAPSPEAAAEAVREMESMFSPGEVCVFTCAEWLRERLAEWREERSSGAAAAAAAADDAAERVAAGLSLDGGEDGEGEDSSSTSGGDDSCSSSGSEDVGDARPEEQAAASAPPPPPPGGEYWTLAEPVATRTEIKKSVFLTHAWPVATPGEAMQKIEAASDPSATHNCWAFKAAGSALSNDDGEPGGTAGRPMLASIEASGLDGVAVLVIRHFGGVKLGASGLVRAYGGAARDALRAAPRVQVKPRVPMQLVNVPFDCLGAVHAAVRRFGPAASAGPEQYAEGGGGGGGNDDDGDGGGGAEAGGGGGVNLTVFADSDSAEALAGAIADATSGRVRPRRE